MKHNLLCLFLAFANLAHAQSDSLIEADLCVYGGTSGGVIAAVQAARMGKSVVIVEPGRHLGGMTSGGLSAVDIGDPRSVGGLAREYFTKLAATVGVELAWDKAFKSVGGGPATGGAYAIEPHQAEELFNAMVSESGVRVYRNARIATVKKNRARLVEFTTEEGSRFRAKMYIDTSYEGDLMARAGVGYTLIREGNAKYGENLNGIQYEAKYQPRMNHLQPGPHGRVPGGQGVWDRDFPLDPFMIKGDPTSGLLPLIQSGDPGIPGEAAPGIQAYCYRLCLTTNPSNRIPIAPPADYDAKRYEIVARFIEACQSIGDDLDLRWFSKHDPLPNEKWDFNTATFGGNLPGASHAWPEASYAEREKIAKEHEDYHRGLLHFLANDPRVPEKVRKDMQRFGLPKDEFTDRQGWPHQIYVRQGRRMVSDLVMTEHHTFGRQVAPKSIGLGSYGTDIHEVRRIVKDGIMIREGKIATGRGDAPPYAIGYDAIVPKSMECENLLVPFALSASHTAFASIRMEPVFMCVSQSAATAACIAIDDGLPVQSVEYSKLKARLLMDRQILEWTVGKTVAVPVPLSTVDFSNEIARQVIVAQGTDSIYQGHPTTVLLPDRKTMYCVWTIGHGGGCGPLKRSEDGGKTWSERLAVPENWSQVKNCPSIYRLTDPQAVTRLVVYAGQGPDGTMHQSVSTDDGRTWSPMRSNGLVCVMPFCTIVPVEQGKKLIGLTNIRRPGETKDTKSNIIAQSESLDGGLSWSPWSILLDLGDLKPCEPEVLRSPDGKQLLCLMRENVRSEPAHFMTSDDEGKNWSAPRPLPVGLHGDRHKAIYASDGRLVICFRDMGRTSPTKNHFVAWVGRYEDIVGGRDGQYKIKLLQSHKGSDCGYPGVELLEDNTIVATTYVKLRPGAQQNSVVSVRFTLNESDQAPKQLHTASSVDAARHAGMVVDDTQAKYVGDWVESTRLASYVGRGYRHDNRQGQGKKLAHFSAKIESTGDYEVRLIYSASSNRATNAIVTITNSSGPHIVRLNQRLEGVENGIPNSLGRFRFEADQTALVTLSNEGADGYVVVDAVQFVPVAMADDERNGVRSAGFAATATPTSALSDSQKNMRLAMATATAVSPLAKEVPGKQIAPHSDEPVQLAKAATAMEIHGKSYDLVVVGGTASGVACAVRASREGCSVLLVQHNRHIGGMLSNGLMQWDALYGGPRSPLMTELLKNIEKDAVARFGRDSKSHQIIRYTHEHYPVGWVEPRVMERECNRLVAGEKNIALLLEHYPVEVQHAGSLLTHLTLRAYGTTRDISVAASMFADATYEGDLAAIAKVPYRVGREARHEYGEPHAGKVFTNIDHGSPQSVAAEGLNIREYGSHQGSIDPTSPFAADHASQAYNYRFCVTKDPANRVMLTEPPSGYHREEYVNYERKSIATNAGPNLKSHMNSPILPGENHAYPEASWSEREKISERHKQFGLGLIWFLQNDESISEKQRAGFREWGLAKDEFPDNGHVPYEMYVREARRIVGRHVITEHDGMLTKDYARAPIHPDSVAVTDWYMDSHSCTLDSRPGFKYDGKLILTEESRPMQVPFRALLPQGIDNLLVPVCLSSTHIAWGALRLEPVWMQTGEAAGWAAALSKKHHTQPGRLDAEILLRTLVENRQLVSFFNELKVDDDDPRVVAAQYFGTKGFFATYHARLDEPISESVLNLWDKAFERLQQNTLNPTQLATEIHLAEQKAASPTSKMRGEILLDMWKKLRASR